jgi:hypothetical protein
MLTHGIAPRVRDFSIRSSCAEVSAGVNSAKDTGFRPDRAPPLVESMDHGLQPGGQAAAQQLAWLAEAGFTGIDCHWLLAGHAIFSGRKA